MGNLLSMSSVNRSNDSDNNCLNFDRILDADHKVYIGIGKTFQVIRFGDWNNRYHKMIKCSEDVNKLTYDFENDITMTLEKSENNIIMNINDSYNKRVFAKIIDPIVVKHFKKIRLSDTSDDFDKIYDLFHSNDDN